MSVDTFSGITGSNSINAGTGTVTITPVTPNQQISLGTTGGSGLNVTLAQLNTITAGTLVFGSSSITGGLSVNAPLTLSQGYILNLVNGSGSLFSEGTAGTNAISVVGGFGVSLGANGSITK